VTSIDRCYLSGNLLSSLHCALAIVEAQCIVIGPVCVCVADGRTGGRAVWVCYYDNWKFRATILTKLGL